MKPTLNTSTAADNQQTEASNNKEHPQAPHLPRNRRNYLVFYNIALSILASVALVLLVALGPYLQTPNEQPPSHQIVIATLITMIVAGAAGGTLCNLRGLFKYHDDENGFPERLEIPFYIRPLMGAVTGLFTFFLGSLLVTSLSIEASNQSWVSLQGRLPYVAVALLAGFAAQEFMVRL